jgi:hypothetical protein
VRREDRAWIVLAVVLLIGGMLIGRRVLELAGGEGTTPFRTWFWDHRSLDVAVQGALILVGALGVAALLPRKEDDE